MADRRSASARKTFYEEWVEKEGLEMIRGFYIEDLKNLSLRWWERIGGSAVHIDLEGTGDLAGAYVCEIEGGKELKPQRHLYEELIFVLTGRGATSVWYEGWPKITFEWEEGSLFAVPLNSWHQHYNADRQMPARFLSVNTSPIVLSLYRQEACVFDNSSVFPERYDGRSDYFSRSEYTAHHVLKTNFVANVYTMPLKEGSSSRGPGGRNVQLDLASGVMGAHILEVPSGSYTKLHRHGPGAHVFWLEGEGYTLTWLDGESKKKVDWKPGTMLVPPTRWWHQHCVLSNSPAKHLALKLNNPNQKVTHMHDGTVTSTREGGNQIEYEDMDPETAREIHQLFLTECAKRGTSVRISQPLNF